MSPLSAQLGSPRAVSLGIPPPTGADFGAATPSASLGGAAVAAPRILRFEWRSTGARPAEAEEALLHLETLSDEDLVRAARDEPARAADFLDPLFRRYQRRVAGWCARVSGRREEAADLAQEVFLRVYERLDQFRFESAFGTWLYLVTRSVAINRSISNRRRDTESIDDEAFPEPVDPAPGVDESVAREMQLASFREAIRAELEPLEAKILHLHFVDELPLAGIDRLLGLDNKSGAKAYIVSAKRKLKRRFAAGAENLKESGEARS